MKMKKKQILVCALMFSLLFTNLMNETILNAAIKGYVKSLKVSSKRVFLKIGKSKKIIYKVMTKKMASKKIIVGVKNPKIVKVTIKGKNIVIKGKRSGTTKIIVTTKGKNRRGKKIKVTLNVTVGEKPNTSTPPPTQSPTPGNKETTKPQDTVMPTESPTETPSISTTNPDITLEPSPLTLETTTFDDFSKAASELIKDNRTVIGESIAEGDTFFAKRLIIKSNGTNLDFSKTKAKAVVKGVDNIYFVQFSTSSDAKMAMSEISNWTNIVYVEPDSYSGDASDDESDNSEDSFLSWGVAKIGADKFAKSLAPESTTEIKVAVVDTGVSKHSFLGNRRTDDGYDFYDNDSEPSDPKGHGTHVAGTIVDCTPGLNVKIMPVRVLGLNGGYSSTVGMGIRYAADHGAKVINLSLGGGHSNYKDDNIKYAVSKGVTVVVSAGNEYGSIDSLYYCPAHISEAICVGAIDSNERKANFSNIGSSLDVVAPGVGIVSCVPGGSYESWNGTSMAAPHVSALAAMVKLANPFYTPAEIEQTIKNNCRDLGTTGRDDTYGYGVPDFSKYAVVIPSGISLNITRATIETGSTVSLEASVTPSNATDKTVTWSSSDTSVATVSDGDVTGKLAGTATITAKTSNGKTATCIVTVKAPDIVATPTPAYTATPKPGFTKLNVDLSTAVDDQGNSIPYNSAEGLTVQDLRLFRVDLPETLVEGSVMEVTLKGILNGEKGFRAYFINNNEDFNISPNIASSEEDEIATGEPFEWTFTLEVNEDCEATQLQFKGKTFTDNIDDLTVSSIVLEYKPASAGTATPKPGFTKLNVDLSTAVDDQGNSIPYNSVKGLTVQDLRLFRVDLPETLEEGSVMDITVKGQLNGEKGFRACFIKNNSDVPVSNIANSDIDEVPLGEPFEWTFTLEVNEDFEATQLQFKGITYVDNIDDLTVSSIVFEYKTPVPTPTPNYEPYDNHSKIVVEDFESYEIGYNWESDEYKGTSGKATKGKEYVDADCGKMTVVQDPEDPTNRCLKIEYNGDTQAYDYAPIFNLKMPKSLDEYSCVMIQSRVVTSNTDDPQYKTVAAYFSKYQSITPEYYFATPLKEDDATKKGISKELIKFSADASHATGKNEKYTVRAEAGSEFEGMVYNNKLFPMFYNNWSKEKKKENRTIGFKENENDSYKAGWHQNKLNFYKGNIMENGVLSARNFSMVIGSRYAGQYGSKNASLTLYLDNLTFLEGETPCTEVKVEDPPTKLAKGMKVQMFSDKISYVPDNTTQTQLTWSSSDEKILKVDGTKSNPVFEGVAAGKATITATVTKNPSVKASFVVEVFEPIPAKSDLTIDLSSLNIFPEKADDDTTTKLYSTINKYTKDSGVLDLKFTQANKDMYVLDLGKTYDLSGYQGIDLTGVATEQMTIELYPDTANFQEDKYWTKQLQFATYPFFEGSHAKRSYEGTSYGEAGEEETAKFNFYDGKGANGNKIEGVKPAGNLTNIRYLVFRANKFYSALLTREYKLKALVFRKDWYDRSSLPTDKEIKDKGGNPDKGIWFE